MKALKIGISVVLLAAALAITLFTGDGSDALPDTPESSVKWRCSDADCQHVFDLSALKSAEAQTRAQSKAPIHCTKCGQKLAYQVIGCQNCGGLFFGTEVPGATGECPVCNPEASPWQRDEDETPDVEDEAERKPRPKNVLGPTRKECETA